MSNSEDHGDAATAGYIGGQTKASIKRNRIEVGQGQTRYDMIMTGEALKRQPARIIYHEDNDAMIQVVEIGRNPTMRHVGRIHGISIDLSY